MALVRGTKLFRMRNIRTGTSCTNNDDYPMASSPHQHKHNKTDLLRPAGSPVDPTLHTEVSLTDTPVIPAGNYELRILQSLRRIIRAIETHSQSLSQQHQVTGPQLACLLAVRDHGSLTTTKLAQAVFLSPSTVVGIVDRLIEKGLACRERGSQDRRQVLITLTEEGDILVNNAPSPLQETLTTGLRHLPELEQVSITLALEKVVDLLNARNIDAAPVLETGPIASPAQPLRRKPSKP